MSNEPRPPVRAVETSSGAQLDTERGADSALLREQARTVLAAGDFDWARRNLVGADHDPAKLIENLRVYQAELEIQNEELRSAQSDAEQAAQRYLQLFAGMPVAGVVLDVLGRILDVNPMACELFGLGSRHLRGHFLVRLLDRDSQGLLLSALQQACVHGRARALELRCLTAGGDRFDAEIDIARLPGEPDDASQRLVAMVVDVSERKRAERRLRELNGQLQEATARATALAAQANNANAAKSEFLAHMSHEIRTPLNLVLGLAQVLERDQLSQDQRSMVGHIRDAGQSLLALLDDILDFSKIEAGQLRISRRPFDLDALLRKILGLMEPAAAEKGLALSLEAPAETLGWVLGDAQRLEQVLLNLLGNAVKFTNQGEIRLQVKTFEETGQEMRVRCSVQDSGIGIGEAALERLFTPFTQADVGISRRFGGTGLGLAICKHLVELMQGTIGVQSALGQGSCFWLELPLSRTGSAPEADTEAAPAPAPSGLRLPGRHLLVVDDSAMNRELVERALLLEGARATCAADGEEALRLLAATPDAFDAVLMDVQMPVLDGLSATRRLRDELGLRDLPVIALSAGVLVEQQAAARAAGVNAFLPKPLVLEQMVAVLLQQVSPAAAQPGPRPAVAATTASGFPEIAGIEQTGVASSLTQDRAFFVRVLGHFVRENADLGEQVRADLAAGQRERAARRLHRLRGSAGNLGALGLMRVAQRLEQAIDAGDQALEVRLTELETRLAELVAASQPWCERSPLMADPRRPLDPGRLRILCDALRSRDLIALSQFAELEPNLAALLGEDGARIVGHAVQGLRFGEALAILESFLADVDS